MALVKHNNNSLTNLTALPSAIPTGKMTLLNTATASSSASLSFDSTYINSDYLIYKFEFINMHPANNGSIFQFNISTDNGSNYNVAKTTTYFRSIHNEIGNTALLGYEANHLAQGTGYQPIMNNIGNANDESCSGSMFLFNPSSTTFVKHFIARTQSYQSAEFSFDIHMAGYGNTTSAVNAIIFAQNSGNIDAGQIKLYGLAN